MPKKQKRVTGAFVKIPLNNGEHGYGRILEGSLFAFYDVKTAKDLPLVEVQSKPILFKIWVMRSAVTSGRWKIVGTAALEEALKVEPHFFKIDPLNKKLSIYIHDKESPATIEECQGLECAAVWSAEHAEDRLRDYYVGRPNKWVESMKIKI